MGADRDTLDQERVLRGRRDQGSTLRRARAKWPPEFCPGLGASRTRSPVPDRLGHPTRVSVSPAADPELLQLLEHASSSLGPKHLVLGGIPPPCHGDTSWWMSSPATGTALTSPSPSLESRVHRVSTCEPVLAPEASNSSLPAPAVLTSTQLWLLWRDAEGPSRKPAGSLFLLCPMPRCDRHLCVPPDGLRACLPLHRGGRRDRSARPVSHTHGQAGGPPASREAGGRCAASDGHEASRRGSRTGGGRGRGDWGHLPPPTTATPALRFLTLIGHQPSQSHLGVWYHKERSPDPPSLPRSCWRKAPRRAGGRAVAPRGQLFPFPLGSLSRLPHFPELLGPRWG